MLLLKRYCFEVVTLLFGLTPLPLVTTQIVTNFKLMMNRPLMQILDLIFAKMCIFPTQTLLSTLKATLKSR